MFIGKYSRLLAILKILVVLITICGLLLCTAGCPGSGGDHDWEDGDGDVAGDDVGDDVGDDDDDDDDDDVSATAFETINGSKDNPDNRFDLSGKLFGGIFADIVILPADDRAEEAYLATNNGAFYMTNNGTDAGDFENLNGKQTEETRLGDTDVYTIAISSQKTTPSDPYIVYAGGGSGVYRSTNRGQEWVLFDEGLPIPRGLVSKVRSVAFTSPNVMYLLYSGTNGSEMYKRVEAPGDPDIWTNVNNDLAFPDLLDADTGGQTPDPRDVVIYDFALPRDAEVVYLGVNGGVFRTTNSGENWIQQNGEYDSATSSVSVKEYNIDKIVVTKQAIDRYVLYAAGDSRRGSSDKIFRGEEDGDVVWKDRSTGLPSYFITQSLALHPQDNDTVYAGLVTSSLSTSGLWKTTNGGLQWERLEVKDPDEPALESIDIRTIAISPEKSPDFLLVDMNGFLYRSDDAGLTWKRLPKELIPRIYKLAAEKTDTDTKAAVLYAATNNSVFVSTNIDERRASDVKWYQKPGSGSETLGSRYIYDIEVSPSDNAIAFALTRSTIYQTTNQGNTWVGIFDTSDQLVRGFNGEYIGNSFASMVIDPRADGNRDTQERLFVAANPVVLDVDGALEIRGRVYRGVWDGVDWDWERITTLNEIQTVGVMRLDVASPTDPPDLWIYDMAIPRLNSSIIYAPTGNGMWMTQLAGTVEPTWWQRSSTIGETTSVLSCATDHEDVNTGYCGIDSGGGIFMTDDNGASWESKNNGITYDTIVAMYVDPSDIEVIYSSGISIGAFGIFKTTDKGENWELLPDNTEHSRGLIVDETGVVFAGTNANMFRGK